MEQTLLNIAASASVLLIAVWVLNLLFGKRVSEATIRCPNCGCRIA